MFQQKRSVNLCNLLFSSFGNNRHLRHISMAEGLIDANLLKIVTVHDEMPLCPVLIGLAPRRWRVLRVSWFANFSVNRIRN